MNLVVQTGRIASDPEIRALNNGNTVANFRIAVQRPYKDANGERQTDFHNCVAYRAHADFIRRYLKKGDYIEVKGTLQNRSYDAQDGTKRYVTEIVCDNVESPRSRSEGTTSQPTPNTDAQTGFAVAEDEPLPF